MSSLQTDPAMPLTGPLYPRPALASLQFYCKNHTRLMVPAVLNMPSEYKRIMFCPECEWSTTLAFMANMDKLARARLVKDPALFSRQERRRLERERQKRKYD